MFRVFKIILFNIIGGIELLSKSLRNILLLMMGLFLLIGLSACSDDTDEEDANSVEAQETEESDEEESEEETDEDSEEETEESDESSAIINNIELSVTEGEIGDEIDFSVDQLEPETDVELIWLTHEGSWDIENQYKLIGANFTEKEVIIAEGTSDENGEWEGSFEVPQGFGDNRTIYVAEEGTKVGQVGFKVHPTFTISPESGPVGTEITVTVEGLGSSAFSRNWQLTYDNMFVGLVSAVTTEGKAEAKLRATGHEGEHVLSLRTGYRGSPYINYLQSPYPDKPEPNLLFTVTDEEPISENYVEDTPEITDGGVEMPELTNESGVEVELDIEEGQVGDPVSLTASGLPEDEEIELVWNTMVGNRVSGLGFEETSSTLDTASTDEDGNLTYDFEVPNDLGGIPHRIDLKVGDDVYGQTYLRILPSIVSMTPESGPPGTRIEIVINGGGWTEFDNAYYLTYDNAYSGYMCSFNSQGELVFETIATGEVGTHLIDLYPGLYLHEEEGVDMTLIPQLTYEKDHPGSAMPAIRMAFEITDEQFDEEGLYRDGMPEESEEDEENEEE